MSYQSIKAKAEVIRSETRVGGNTKGRIADILDDLNDTKADKVEVQAYIDDLNEKNDELNAKVDSMGANGFKGEAVPTTIPTEYNPIQYPDGLYEKYDVRTAGTYTNFIDNNGAPIVVTSEDVEKNVVYISVTNGVSKLNKIPVQGTTAKTEFDPTDNTNPATMKATAERYDPLLKVNEGFLQKTKPPIETPITIDESHATFGGLFLQEDNTYTTNSQYPNIGLVYNLDVSNVYRIDITGLVNIGQNAKPAMLGITKSGAVEWLIANSDPNIGSLHKVDVEKYEKVTIQVVQGSFPTIKALYYGAVTTIDAKKYTDDKLQVLDFFLNPFEVSDPITVSMPRPNENKNAFITTSWGQFSVPDSSIHNGVIKISEVSNDMSEIIITGTKFGIAGEGIMWLGVINTDTGNKVNLMSGVKSAGTYSFKVDPKQFDSIVYSRLEGDITISYRKTVKTEITKNSVQEYIDTMDTEILDVMTEKYDRTLTVLDSFVNPKGETDWQDLTAEKIEYTGIVFNTGGATEAQPEGACGLIYAKDLEGVSSLRVVGENMDLYGTTIAWWLGYRADNTFDVLRHGIVASGSANIKTDPQYSFYRYSRPLNNAKLQMKKEVILPVEVDSVLDLIKSSSGGYAGILDLGSLGVKTTNTAEQNTSIINNAINEESSKSLQRLLMFPAGIFKVNEILLAPKTFLGGVDKEHTGLYTEAGSGTRSIIRQVNGQVQGGGIFNLSINGTNATEGAVYINNTFGFKITNCSIQSNAQYGIKLTACLYHSISDIYCMGGDYQLHTITTQQMATNLVKYDRLYFVKGVKNCVRLEGGSNYVFTSCNFEDSGISGDETTGGVRAINLSANGEGVDVAFNNCWSEGVRGGYIYKFENCKGNSVLRDVMIGNGGNGAGTIAQAVHVVGSNVLISGATKFSIGSHFQPFPINIKNEGGSVLVDNPNINVDSSPNTGTIRKAVYS